jgi:hypothetical protein
VCLYSTVSKSFVSGRAPATDYVGVAMAGDGNITSGGNAFMDTSGNMLGQPGSSCGSVSLARPVVLYPGMTSTPYPMNNYPANTMQRPRLNAAKPLLLGLS